MSDSNLHDGHRARMREKYLKFGADAFSDHELIEMLLYYSVPRTNTNNTAHLLLDRFDSVEKLLSADIPSLQSVDGVGERSAMLVSLAGALNKRSKKKKASSKMRFSNLESVGNFFAERFSGSTKEIVAAMYLDNKMHLIDVSTIAEGSIGEAAFAPSKIVRNAIIKDASAVILAHNHPGGVAVASLSDRNISIVLETSLAAVEIPLIEHLIITEVGYTPTLMFKPHTARTNITTRIFGEDFYRKFYK